MEEWAVICKWNSNEAVAIPLSRFWSYTAVATVFVLALLPSTSQAQSAATKLGFSTTLKPNGAQPGARQCMNLPRDVGLLRWS